MMLADATRCCYTLQERRSPCDDASAHKFDGAQNVVFVRGNELRRSFRQFKEAVFEGRVP